MQEQVITHTLTASNFCCDSSHSRFKISYKSISSRQEPMAYERSTAFKTSLPPETWRIVLHSVGTQPHDLVELWTGCRGVSKFFKHEVEELFIADYLPRTTLSFAVTTSQGFDRHSRIEFHDHNLQMEYSRVSVDRNRAFFRAQYCDYARNSEIMSLAQEEEDEYDNDEFTKLFQKKHDSNSEATAKLHQQVCRSAPHHLVDFWRPSGNAALPKVFFHANGEVEVGWRELFAAVLAEEKYYYEAGWTPIDFQVSQLVARKNTC